MIHIQGILISCLFEFILQSFDYVLLLFDVRISKLYIYKHIYIFNFSNT